MPAPLPCILLARPTAGDDPALLQHQGRPLLPPVLRELTAQGLAGPVILSVSGAVPQDIRQQLLDWGLDVRVHASDRPQERLPALMAELDLPAALVTTPYAYLLQAGALRDAARAVQDGADLAFTPDVTAARFLMACNRKAAEALAGLPSHPVPPFAFPEKLARFPQLRLQPLEGLEEPGEQFLWELFYAGERSVLPAAHLAAFLDGTPPQDWFRAGAQQDFLKRLHGVDGWSALNAPLQRLAPKQQVKRLAMHVHYLARIQEHIPRTGGRFLEIGYGRTPVTSCLLAGLFESGVAVEPYNHSDLGFSGTLDLFDLLLRDFPALLPVKPRVARWDPRQQVDFRRCKVEELGLADKSIDFCLSRVVLEHIKNVEELSVELRRVLRPGGVMLHEIDFKDHDDLASLSFGFLRHSKEEWAALDKITNLWRVNDFVNLWQGLGFAVDVLSRKVRKAPPQRLHPSWNGYADEDLYCYTALIRARKQ